MLRKIRIAAAAIVFTLVTLLFLDFTGTLHKWFGWLAEIQFLPAVLALNFGVVAVLAVITLIFGRVYCSVICPLGVMQDIIQILLVARTELAEIRHTCLVYRSDCGRIRVFCRPDCPVQRIRKDSQQFPRPSMAMGQQSSGMVRRTDRQLRLLQYGSLAEKPACLHRRRGHFRSRFHPDMEERENILQYDLPRGLRSGPAFTVFPVQACHRYGKMQELRTVRQALQGILHKH